MRHEPKRPRGRRIDWAGYAMLLPSYTIYFVFTLLPLCCTIVYSLTDFDGFSAMNFVGGANFSRLLRDGIFLRAAQNTCLLYTSYTAVHTFIVRRGRGARHPRRGGRADGLCLRGLREI